MTLTTNLYKLLSSRQARDLERNRRDPGQYQEKLFNQLVARGANTTFGEEHGFTKGMSYTQFSNQLPLRNYNQFVPYINKVRKGEKNVLWDGPTAWFAKSSGTSAAQSKFIPITKESLRKCHVSGIKQMLTTYVINRPDSRLFKGKSLTLGGHITIDELGGGESRNGDLSAILLYNSPLVAELMRVPRRKVALLDDFEKKVEYIARHARKWDLTNFAGVPSWNLVMIKRIMEYNKVDDLREIWPNLELFMHGGISFDPYRPIFNKVISGEMYYMENYNASEGYFAFQDDPNDSGMLLLTNNGVFYEFIPMKKLQDAIDGKETNFETVDTVKTGVNYAIVLTTNGGLWRYLIGDTIQFTSLKPHKFIITGRTQLYINAFGEELMIHNAENALADAAAAHQATVTNYTVAPIFMEEGKKGAHQWLIEFSMQPDSLYDFVTTLDNALRDRNSDYDAKRTGGLTMVRPEVIVAESGLFYNWMANRDKLGGQNKVPRLSNDRHHIDDLLSLNKEIREKRQAR